MYKRILDYINENRMLLSGERVIAGLSGGADSVCLLYLLNQMKEELNIQIKAVHVHHGLRGAEADRDADYAEELSQELGVPFVCVHADVKVYAKDHLLSEEEAGRILRYEILEKERINWNADKIAVAHHQDDQAETILHHLFRGSGLKGLGGIRPVRGCIIRPLLCVGREEILGYLKEKSVSYCEDSTNAGLDYARNRMRSQVIPMIKEQINHGAVSNILHAGKLAAQADSYFEEMAAELLKKNGCYREETGEYGISVNALVREPEIVRSYVIRRMIRQTAGSERDVTAVHISKAAELLDKGSGRQISLPYGLISVKIYGELWIKRKKPEGYVEKGREKPLPLPELQIFPCKKGQEFPENGYTKWFDYDKMGSAPLVRYRRTGDYITLAGGGRKSVKSFMIDEKIPREERDGIPLVADGSHVVWIIGYRISEYYKITDTTKTILQIQLNGGKNNGR